MKIIFAGTPDTAATVLKILLETSSAHQVVAVLTREDAPVGRKRILTPSPVAQAAEKYGLPVIKANRITEAVTAEVAGLKADIGVVVAYGALLPNDCLQACPGGWLNLHYSLLPSWRGASPVQSALINGDEQIGYSIIKLVEQLDAGDIYSQQVLEDAGRLTVGEILDKMSAAGGVALIRVLDDISSGSASLQPQAGATSYAKKLSRQDGYLNFALSSEEIFNRFRGVTPEPGAWSSFEGESLKVLELAAPADDERSGAASVDSTNDSDLQQLPAGKITMRHKQVIVKTADGALRLKTVQPAGKKAMDALSWWNGLSADSRDGAHFE